MFFQLGLLELQDGLSLQDQTTLLSTQTLDNLTVSNISSIFSTRNNPTNRLNYCFRHNNIKPMSMWHHSK